MKNTFWQKHIHYGERNICEEEQERPIFYGLCFDTNRRQTEIQQIKD